jgi:hypothetical protein
MKSNPPASLLKTPADVNVISSRTETRIETSDRLKRGFANCQITSGNMFGLAVRKEHVHRPAGRVGNTGGNLTVAGRGDVRSTHTYKVRIHESGGQVVEPLRIRIGIVVNVSHYLARGRFRAGITRAAQAAVFGVD